MNKISTLIFLVNKIRSEVRDSFYTGCDDYDESTVELKDGYAPPHSAVSTILDFARSLEVKESEAIGKFEWVLN
jgi:hypothetical protein